MQIANEHKEEFTQIAEKVIKENGYNYTVNVQIGKADFPTKYYGDITLPAGTYDALKVQIGGEAKRSKLVVCNVSSFMFCRCKHRNCAR